MKQITYSFNNASITREIAIRYIEYSLNYDRNKAEMQLDMIENYARKYPNKPNLLPANNGGEDGYVCVTYK